MLNKKNVINYILKEIPEFKFTWDEHVKYWNNEEDKRSIGLDLDNFLDFS